MARTLHLREIYLGDDIQFILTDGPWYHNKQGEVIELTALDVTIAPGIHDPFFTYGNHEDGTFTMPEAPDLFSTKETAVKAAQRKRESP